MVGVWPLPTRNAGSWCWPTPSSASIDSSELQKTQQKLRSESWTISRGEGGLRGQRTLPAPSSILPGHWESCILLHCPCCVWQARFAPHPRPLSPVRGEGGLRGQRTLPVPSPTLPRHCESSILLHCPCCAWQARFTPHPRPLSPVRGEGSQMLFPQESQGHWAAAMRLSSG